MPSVKALQARIHNLEQQLLTRPQIGDVAHARERMERKERMYEAVLARNEILKRRLDEAHQRVRELELDS